MSNNLGKNKNAVKTFAQEWLDVRRVCRESFCNSQAEGTTLPCRSAATYEGEYIVSTDKASNLKR